MFVTLGGYSAEAQAFERGKPNLRLIDGPALVDLVLAHYDAFEVRYKMLMPLKRTFVASAAGTDLISG